MCLFFLVSDWQQFTVNYDIYDLYLCRRQRGRHLSFACMAICIGRNTKTGSFPCLFKFGLMIKKSIFKCKYVSSPETSSSSCRFGQTLPCRKTFRPRWLHLATRFCLVWYHLRMLNLFVIFRFIPLALSGVINVPCSARSLIRLSGPSEWIRISAVSLFAD